MLPAGRQLGGAPFNVTAQLRRMGFAAAYLTAVGDDEAGRAALARMRTEGVDTSLVRVVRGAPTGRAEVLLDADGSPRFAIASPAAHERLAEGDLMLAAGDPAPEVLVCGTLAATRGPTRAAIRSPWPPGSPTPCASTAHRAPPRGPPPRSAPAARDALSCRCPPERP
jgi:fructokinase